MSVDSIMDAMREAWAGLDTVDSSARMIVTGPNDRIVGDMGMRVQCTRKPRGARWSVGERETTIVDGRLQVDTSQPPVEVESGSPAQVLSQHMGASAMPVELWLFWGEVPEGEDEAAFLLSLMCGGTVGRIDSMQLLESPSGQARIQLEGLGGTAVVTIDTNRHVMIKAICVSRPQGAPDVTIESAIKWEVTSPDKIEPPIDL